MITDKILVKSFKYDAYFVMYEFEDWTRAHVESMSEEELTELMVDWPDLMQLVDSYDKTDRMIRRYLETKSYFGSLMGEDVVLCVDFDESKYEKRKYELMQRLHNTEFNPSVNGHISTSLIKRLQVISVDPYMINYDDNMKSHILKVCPAYIKYVKKPHISLQFYCFDLPTLKGVEAVESDIRIIVFSF